MTPQLLIGTLSILLASSLMFGCAQVDGQASLPLAGNTPYTGALPPPNHIQANSAINASTMIAPSRP